LKEEAEAISSDPIMRARVLASVHLFLDFLGMKLEVEQGEAAEAAMNATAKVKIVRTAQFRERYDHWEGSITRMRITRCLNSLGELGMAHLKRPIVEFLVQEIIQNELHGCSGTCEGIWMRTLDQKDQDELYKMWQDAGGNVPERYVKDMIK